MNVTVDTKRPTETGLVESSSSDGGLSNDAVPDASIDNAAALTTEIRLRHPTIEDVQPSELGAAAVRAHADGLDVSEDTAEALVWFPLHTHVRLCQTHRQTKESRNRACLQNRLKAARVRNVDGKFFIPVDRIHRLITQESVIKELRHCNLFVTDVHFFKSIPQIAQYVSPVDTDRMGNTIHQDRKTIKDISMQKIFGILVSMDMSASIGAFLDDGLSDTDLPLSFTRHEGTTHVTSSAGSKAKLLSWLLTRNNERSLPLVERFIKFQREFAAPFFTRKLSRILYKTQRLNLSRATVLARMLRDLSVTTALGKQCSFDEMWEAVMHKGPHAFGLKKQVCGHTTLKPDLISPSI